MFIIIVLSLIISGSSFGMSNKQKEDKIRAAIAEKESKARKPKYLYGYFDREHNTKETLNHIGGIYLASWAVYPLTQPSVVKEKGSWDNYKNNFGEIVFDQDEPFWNWFVHPLSGSQLYLYYRANGYSRVNSVAMAAISSTLFEFTIEIYTEPASVQDLYQTPVLGSLIGVGLESLSMYLLNSGTYFGRFWGHVLNPMTLFWFYEGKVRITPDIGEKGKVGFLLNAQF